MGQPANRDCFPYRAYPPSPLSETSVGPRESIGLAAYLHHSGPNEALGEFMNCNVQESASHRGTSRLLRWIGIGAWCIRSWTGLDFVQAQSVRTPVTEKTRSDAVTQDGASREAVDVSAAAGNGTFEVSAYGHVAPEWIWGSEGADVEAEAGRCDFLKSFSLDEVHTGRLEIVCDNQYVVRLNGRLIGIGNQWKQWTAYDVSPFLVVGENRIQVRCRNEGGPAGLAVKLILASAAGPSTSEVIATDASWEAKPQSSGTWDPTIDAQTPWVPATVLGAVGSIEPWGEVAAAKELVALRASRRVTGEATQMQDGDRVLFLGSTIVERAQRYGDWEMIWTAAFPDKKIVFRNLGWSGDTVFGHARARFGTVQDGFDHLETHVFAEQPDWIVVAYGTNESFAGESGLPTFREGLKNLLDILEGTGARLVLMTPPPMEAGPGQLDPTLANANLRIYRDAIAEEATSRGYPLVDLFEKLPEWTAKFSDHQPVTDNGMHLNAAGYWMTAQVLASELGMHRGVARIEVDLTTRTMKTNGCYADQLQVTPMETRFAARGQSVPVLSPVEGAPSSRWVRVSGLKPGNYQLFVDDILVARARAEDWANGVSIRRGPEFDQAQSLREAIAEKNDLYFHRWRPQNETYLFLFRKHEQGNNAVEIPQFDPLIDEVEHRIAMLRVPQTKSYVLRAD